MRDHVRLAVNGNAFRVEGADVFRSLADWLRTRRRATGTKVVCAEGDCGACTVLVARPRNGTLDYLALNSCILFIHQLDGAHIVTVEGLGPQLSPVQESMVENHGAQCGYCTPGFVMAMTGLLRDGALAPETASVPEEPRNGGTEEPGGPRVQAVREGLTGNLCRCTGYEPIIRAALDAPRRSGQSIDELYPAGMLSELLRDDREEIRVEAGGQLYCGPATFAQALRFKAEHPEAVVVQGGTDVGVAWNKRGYRPPAILGFSRIEGLDEIRIEGAKMRVGARATLTDLKERAGALLPELDGILDVFGAPQIRNGGTLAGNIGNGSPVADTLPFLFVADAVVEAESVRGARSIPITSFYRGYKTLALDPDELIRGVSIEMPAEGEILRLYKVSKRRDLDIASFTAAVRMRLEGGRMRGVRISYGGVAPVVLRLPKTEAILEGNEPSGELFARAGSVARSEIAPISDVRGTAEYRSLLGERILMKFFVETLSGETSEVRVSA